MTLDLFPSETLASPAAYWAAMGDWLAAGLRDGRLQHESSAEMYEHMWGAWTAWAVGNGVGLFEVTSEDLSAYLQSRGGAEELSNRYTWRFLKLVDNVLANRADMLGVEHNLAAVEFMNSRPDIRYANASDADPLPEHLAPREAKDVVTYLSAVRPGRVSAGIAWQEVRNRASVGLMLGGGLTPGEVRALKLEDAVAEGGSFKGVPWKLRVAGNGNSPARETPLAAWAGRLLRHWMNVREEQRVPGAMMFPATKSTGKQWGKVAQYNAAKAVLHAAGVEGESGGSFRLRHTFALRQLRRGKSPADVARWLGITDPPVMARYMRLVSAPVDLA